jgi:hypothetical protein
MPKAKVDADIYLELRRIGVNVNQIAHALNRGDEPELDLIKNRLNALESRLDSLALSLSSGSTRSDRP